MDFDHTAKTFPKRLGVVRKGFFLVVSYPIDSVRLHPFFLTVSGASICLTLQNAIERFCWYLHEKNIES